MNENDTQVLATVLAKAILAFIFANLIVNSSLGLWWVFFIILIT